MFGNGFHIWLVLGAALSASLLQVAVGLRASGGSVDSSFSDVPPSQHAPPQKMVLARTAASSKNNPTVPNKVFRVLVIGRTVAQCLERLPQTKELENLARWRTEVFPDTDGASWSLDLVHVDETETPKAPDTDVTEWYDFYPIMERSLPWTSVRVLGVSLHLKNPATGSFREDEWPARLARVAGGGNLFHLVTFDFSVLKFFQVGPLLLGLSELPLDPTTSLIVLQDVATKRPSISADISGERSMEFKAAAGFLRPGSAALLGPQPGLFIWVSGGPPMPGDKPHRRDWPVKANPEWTFRELKVETILDETSEFSFYHASSSDNSGNF